MLRTAYAQLLLSNIKPIVVSLTYYIYDVSFDRLNSKAGTYKDWYKVHLSTILLVIVFLMIQFDRLNTTV